MIAKIAGIIALLAIISLALLGIVVSLLALATFGINAFIECIPLYIVAWLVLYMAARIIYIILKGG